MIVGCFLEELVLLNGVFELRKFDQDIDFFVNFRVDQLKSRKMKGMRRLFH